MVTRGRVQNGVVVLEEGVRLPEGQDVTVLAASAELCTAPIHGSRPYSLLDVPPVSLGAVLPTPITGDDLLDEMLDGRP
jgi:hypothetical protein